MATEGERLLTAVDVAKRLQMSPETIKRYLRSGELKGVRFGFRAGWRVHEQDLQAFIEQRARDSQHLP